MAEKPADPAELRRALNGVAMPQAGYFTAAQARQVGYSYQAQRYHVLRGNWMRVDRGLFRLPDWPAAGTDIFVRWLLWTGDRGVVSHESALTLHELGDVNPTKIHLTVPKGFRAQGRGVVLHKADLPAEDIDERPGLRVTTVERTLLDVASSDLSQEQLDVAVADSLDRGLVSPRRIRSRSDNHGARAALRIERALNTVSR